MHFGAGRACCRRHRGERVRLGNMRASFLPRVYGFGFFFRENFYFFTGGRGVGDGRNACIFCSRFAFRMELCRLNFSETFYGGL